MFFAGICVEHCFIDRAFVKTIKVCHKKVVRVEKIKYILCIWTPLKILKQTS